jgi:hypothetical protein
MTGYARRSIRALKFPVPHVFAAKPKLLGSQPLWYLSAAGLALPSGETITMPCEGKMNATVKNMKARDLTNDERKAAEAAFQGRPFNSQWSESARVIYDGIFIAMLPRGFFNEERPKELVGRFS